MKELRLRAIVLYNVFGSSFSGKTGKLKEMLDLLDLDYNLDRQLEEGKKSGLPIEVR